MIITVKRGRELDVLQGNRADWLQVLDDYGRSTPVGLAIWDRLTSDQHVFIRISLPSETAREIAKSGYGLIE